MISCCNVTVLDKSAAALDSHLVTGDLVSGVLPDQAMVFRILADLTVVLHAGFVVFVVLGGVLVVRWPRVAWVHLPAVAWGAWIEFAGWICPLTPLENWLRVQGAEAAYTSSFIEHYLIPLVYPASLSRPLQYALGALVLIINGIVYAVVLGRRARA